MKAPRQPMRRLPEPRHVINEELFSCILAGERRRADRSNRPLAVLTLAADDHRSADVPLIWREVIQALDACTRDTDVVGWIERRARLGIILHEVHAHEVADPRELEVRVRQTLARYLDADTVARFSIRLHVHAVAEHPNREGTVPLEVSGFPQRGRAEGGNPFYEAVKRVLDVVGSLSLLVLLAPLFLVIAALVKIKSPGPVFFEQVRIGRMMKPFRMLKFRTMCVNADPSLHHEFVSRYISSSGQRQEAGRDAFFKLTNDPRITTVGRVLRKTSLDELPQLWNVVRGEMSLVGPRPPLPYEVEQYKQWHTRRLTEAKPGITGLWQVGGRSRTTFDEMVRLDLRYARTCSFWTDIKILLATPGAVFTGKGAC